jgi:hypothetical protein
MMSTHNHDNDSLKKQNLRKVGLGGKINSEYTYSSRIDFKEDLSLQITKLMQEKKAKDELETHIIKIRKVVSGTKSKKKNIDYYRNVGKSLSFLDNANFKNIKPYSVFRRLIDEIPGILPGLEAKRIQDHLMMMYRIYKLDDRILNKATWDQWYEISKFKNVINNHKILKLVLTRCRNSSGPDIRRKIQSLINI